MNFAAVLHYAYVTCIFHQYITELVNCSFTETFFQQQPERVVTISKQQRHEFCIMAFLHMPERVVAVTKHPRREISCRGSFDIATTRSGCFFLLIERFPSLSVTYTPLIIKLRMRTSRQRYEMRIILQINMHFIPFTFDIMFYTKPVDIPCI
jgi:hypothetical protein